MAITARRLGTILIGTSHNWHLRCSWRPVLARSGRWSGPAGRPC